MQDPEEAFGASVADVAVHLAGVMELVAARADAEEARVVQGGEARLMEAPRGRAGFPAAVYDPVPGPGGVVVARR